VFSDIVARQWLSKNVPTAKKKKKIVGGTVLDVIPAVS
jgi:hypothetical protein